MPGAVLAQNSAGHQTDIAIEHSEFVQLPVTAIARAVCILRSEGLAAAVISIHINGWFGSYSKLEGAGFPGMVAAVLVARTA